MKLYLDSKPKVVNIAGKPHIFQFAKGLKFVVINGHPFKTNFGGHSMTVYVNNREHFLRLTALPPGVMPAEVSDTKGSDLPGASTRDMKKASLVLNGKWSGSEIDC